MAEISQKKRIWGWMFFDWAQQPYATLGLTFIFGPYFAAVATGYFIAEGLSEASARVEAQSLWTGAQAMAGLVIAFSAPFVGAIAGATGRRKPWFYVFIGIAITCSAMLWGLLPDGTGLMMILAMFWIGFVASESAFSLYNSILPSLGDTDETGRISGGATAFGYWGGVLSLFVMLLFFAENETGKTLIGLDPILGLDASEREGTRAVGPFIAIWFAVFIIPFFLWTKDKPTGEPAAVGKALKRLWASIRAVFRKRSYGSFLLGSMFYRDALSMLYSAGGVYANLVLEWTVIEIGVFGIIAAIAAAVLSWVGGIADARLGPKPVIVFSIWVLIGVCAVIVGMSRESLFGVPLGADSGIPDVIFYLCGAAIGGAGGALYSASRSMMVRHCTPETATEAFGLFALTGRATAFLAPALVTVATTWTQSNQLGYLPVLGLFLLGLILLRWVNPEGDQAK
ncbi:MFS transporter [Roseobacteraceae bacterium S113]